ncbi:MAG: aminotransferase class V-fold PLP-dependent enzyme [Oscillospiraceae bacterium]|nr:aminotransferase class V-fold PLP-dependent enzyme [Oscillospiraceae bacterium]
MKRVYLDNGSTSFPKAPGVGEAMRRYCEDIGVNIGRGGYEEAYSAADVILETREKLCELFGFDKPENVVFTSGITASINMVLKGFLRPGDHVLASSVEHNAVIRPLRQLEQTGVEVTLIPCNTDGRLYANTISRYLKPNSKAVVMTHASNVCGTILPIREVAKVCQEYGVRLIVDCAQTGGVLKINMKEWGVDALAFAGHKGLLGPQGTGGFIIKDDFACELTPLISGGTGSISHLETVPDFMPDRFESGTQNLPGLFGLNAAIRYLTSIGTEKIYQREMELTQTLLQGLCQLKKLRIVGIPSCEGRVAPVSIDCIGKDNARVAYELEQSFGIMTRCGLHCAPLAHKTLGTYPRGTIRITPGHRTTTEEIYYAIDAIKAVLDA